MGRVGLAGLGTVGSAVAHWLATQGGAYGLSLTAVSARDRGRTRGCDLSGIAWCDDARNLALRDDVDVVTEVIGGADGVALDLARAALMRGKPLVTANKAMLARHLTALDTLAAAHETEMRFEAAVCGAIPVVRVLREGLAGNPVLSVRGILNGTCNYILTRMDADGLAFDAALAEAQRLGYAEADPAADIDGHDAACKLAILAALAFGGAPDLAAVAVTGIRAVTLQDVVDARSRGGVLRLVGQARLVDGRVAQSVGIECVAADNPLASVHGVANAVIVETAMAGPIVLQGAGAGGQATASAIVADLLSLKQAIQTPKFIS